MTTEITDQATLLVEALRRRRSFSLKQLAPDPIDRGAVALMLEAAGWAPNHGRTAPWRFTVYSGAGRQALSAAFGVAYQQLTPADRYSATAEQAQRDRIWQAPVWISLGMVVVLDERGERRMPEWEELIAVGCAVQNAHLVASALGLGAKWTSGAVATHSHVAELVGLTPPARLLGFLYVGRPAVPWPAAEPPAPAERVRWVTDATDNLPAPR
ncbi:MAG: nitroreductase [Chloroflexota bacterium]|nr:nitroreductase [Chloroflexota bacterium]